MARRAETRLVEVRRLFDESALVRMRLIEQMVTIRTRQGRFVPLRANRMQRAFEERCGRENVVLKARQVGMTTWVAARCFVSALLEPGTLTLHVAHTRDAADGILKMERRMWDGLPEEMQDALPKLVRASAGRMLFSNGSEIRAASAADANAGRGLSVQRLHCSEVSRWGRDAGLVLAGLRAALAPDGQCVLESTAQGAYGAFYEAWVDGASEAVRHFFPWWMEEAYVGPMVPTDAMSDEEHRLVELHGLTGEQIGFRRRLERTYGTLRLQEFAEDAATCFRATGACVFDVDAVERRLAEAPEPRERRDGGRLWVWLPPLASRRYVLGVDSAGGGVDGDFAAVQVIDVATGMQCAELQARLRPAELAACAARLAKEYGDAVVVVERNNHGAAVLAHLESSERYENVWRDARGEAGWLTNASSKPGMIAGLERVLREAPERIMSRRLLAECRTFVSGGGGKLGASTGSHDDLVMAMAVAEAVRGERSARG